MDWDDDSVSELDLDRDVAPFRFDADDAAEPSAVRVKPWRGPNPEYLYAKDLARCKPLTQDQQQQLSRRVRRGDAGALRAMIEGNLRLVVRIARRYRHCGIPHVDLVEEGNLGLMRAVEKYDPDRGVRFASHAIWWIRDAISHAIHHQLRLVYLPKHVVQRLCQQGKAASASHPRSVLSTIRRMEEIVPLDLSGMDGEGRNDLADGLIGDDSTAVMDALSEEAAEARLNGWLNRLGPDARELICRRFGLRGDDAQSPREMAVHLGRSIAAVQSQLTRSLRQLRAIAGAEGFDAEAVFH